MLISSQTNLEKNGYILISNILTDDELNYGLSSIKKSNKIDYSIMKQFIDNIFLEKIKTNCKIMIEPIYVKFRFSNNNNSTDASTFHGDIYNHNNTELLPIYTCLCYFDNAQLEIIPGSHKYNNNDWSINSYNKKTVINVNKGDIMIFHANMHHRGINYNKLGNRRLLQVFEVFPNKEIYNTHASKLVIVKSYDNIFIKKCMNPFMYRISKFPIIINYITFFHYILMYNDMHYKISLIDIEPWNKKNMYITYEFGRRSKMGELINNEEDFNVNIICDENIKSSSCSNYYLYLLITILVIVSLIVYFVFLIYSLYNNGSNRTKGTYRKKGTKIIKNTNSRGKKK